MDNQTITTVCRKDVSQLLYNNSGVAKLFMHYSSGRIVYLFCFLTFESLCRQRSLYLEYWDDINCHGILCFLVIFSFSVFKGMFYQWIECACIWLVGLTIQLLRSSPPVYPLAMIGGVFWTTGKLVNLCLSISLCLISHHPAESTPCFWWLHTLGLHSLIAI